LHRLNPIYLFFTFCLIIFCFFTFYNIPIVTAGVRNLLFARKKKKENARMCEQELPTISIIVPVKNEEKVAARLLDALLNLNYPTTKKEIIVVNDASIDKTQEICTAYSLRNPKIRVFNRTKSTTKAAALNFGVKHAQGEIIATFDGDSVPEPDALLNAMKYFADSAVAGVQGRICSINADQNMLTKFLSYECAAQYEVYMRGKDALDLFVGLAGTCQFIRRAALKEVGGWNENCLAEDTELSIRLTEKDYVLKYASEVRTWEESPFSIKGLVAQRARWYRGNIEVGTKFGRLMKRPSFRRFDAEMTLFGTFTILLCVVNYFMAFWAFSMPPAFMTTILAQFTSLFTMIILGFAGVGLACATKPFRIRNVLWLPFIYAYWAFQSFIAMYALFQIILRRPRKWHKTTRSGFITTAQKEKVTGF
jgi:cellulose synthase/poly-beta-1,6-N-acetylglucosamine synthase-like glycosyltransferase